MADFCDNFYLDFRYRAISDTGFLPSKNLVSISEDDEGSTPETGDPFIERLVGDKLLLPDLRTEKTGIRNSARII